MAINRLRSNGHEVVAIGSRKGQVQDVPILSVQEDFKDIDTVTLYLNPKNQAPYLEYILGLKPKRIIFNPGTENLELMRLADAQGVDTIEACTLVMLRIGQY